MTCSVRLRSAVSMAVVAMALGACSSDGPASDSKGAATTPSDTPPAHRTHRPYSDQNPRPHRGGDFVVKELNMTRGGPDADRPGLDFWGEDVRTCVTRSSSGSQVVGWGDWSADGSDGRVYPAVDSSAYPLSTPTYPTRKVLAPGQCVAGWVWIPVQKLPGGPAAIRFAPGGGPTLIEWKTLR